MNGEFQSLIAEQQMLTAEVRRMFSENEQRIFLDQPLAHGTKSFYNQAQKMKKILDKLKQFKGELQ